MADAAQLTEERERVEREGRKSVTESEQSWEKEGTQAWKARGSKLLVFCNDQDKWIWIIDQCFDKKTDTL